VKSLSGASIGNRWRLLKSKDIQDAVKAELQKGGSPFAIPQTLKLPQYQDLAFYDQWFPLNVQAVLFDILLGPVGYRNTDRTGRSIDTCSCSPSNAVSAPTRSSSNSASAPTYSSSNSASAPSYYSSNSVSAPLPTYSSSQPSYSSRHNKYNKFKSQISNFKSQLSSESPWQPYQNRRYQNSANSY